MNLQALEYTPEYELPAHAVLRRIQWLRARADATRYGPVITPRPGSHRAALTGRFDLMTDSVGYFADSPLTAIYEALARREKLSLSLAELKHRALLVVQVTASLRLLDVRPHARSLPVLQSLRIRNTQELATSAAAAGYQGVVYRSAQQAEEDCYALFGKAMKCLKLVERQPLVAPNGISLHGAVVEALRGSMIPLTR
jgi:hypothetical protein